MLGRKRGKGNIPNHSLWCWDPRAGISPRNGPACSGPWLGWPSAVCNHKLELEPAAPRSSRGCGEKGSVHVGKLPELVFLKGVFLLAWQELSQGGAGMGEP